MKKIWKDIKPLVPASLTVIVLVVLYLVGSQLELGKNIKPAVYILVTIGFIVLYLSIFLLHSALYKKAITSHIKESVDDVNEYVGRISNCSEKPVVGKNCCPKDGRLCSAQEFMQSDYYGNLLNQQKVSDDVCKQYNLITDTDFDKIEAEYFSKDNHPNGEIWVVSNALETEIKKPQEFAAAPDASLQKSMKVVQNNIKNGGKYIQFVALGPKGFSESVFLERRAIYWEALPGLNELEKRKRMPVIRIDTESIEGKPRDRNEDPDFEYLVKLTSTVLFVDTSGGQNYREGYICLRPDDSPKAKAYERRTILFQMPNCMKDDYYDFLKQKKEEYETLINEKPAKILKM